MDVKSVTLEEWELLYLRDAVASSIARFSETLLELKNSGVNSESIETVIDNFRALSSKLEAVAKGDTCF